MGRFIYISNDRNGEIGVDPSEIYAMQYKGDFLELFFKSGESMVLMGVVNQYHKEIDEFNMEDLQSFYQQIKEALEE